MPHTGHSIIGGVATPGAAGTIRATNPATGEPLDGEYTALVASEVAAATAAATAAFATYRHTSPTERAEFLDAIAEELEAVGAQLIATAHAESGLPVARLTGELGRTCGQLRLFARVVRQGDHLGVRIDPALPDRAPLPRPDLRLRQIPLGPVAVFGASNFPLAFSTAGGDTASALAAGCPVVVKAHNAHPGTAGISGLAIAAAARRCGLPAGVFSLVYGLGNEVGAALVTDPAIQAVGFTGSRAGGLALVAAAAARPRPIPVYAEMSSVNPVILLPGALAGEVDALAAGYLASLTNGAGQFCTNPGLLFVPAGPAGDRFLAAVAAAASDAPGQTMLTPGICDSFVAGVERLARTDGVDTVVAGVPGPTANAPAPRVFVSGLEDLVRDPALTDEVFGASGLVVRYGDLDSLIAALARLDGQLTATIHASAEDEQDVAAASRLLPALESLCGRIAFNGWPTGVEVCHAMVHGGPFPASSDGRSTSVGSLAIERFQRPVAYQDVPGALLPPPLQDDNPWQLTRRVDGTLVLAD